MRPPGSVGPLGPGALSPQGNGPGISDRFEDDPSSHLAPVNDGHYDPEQRQTGSKGLSSVERVDKDCALRVLQMPEKRRVSGRRFLADDDRRWESFGQTRTNPPLGRH